MAIVEISELKAALIRDGRLMALDVGSKTIGIATSDALRMLATPLSTLKRGELAVATLREVEAHRASAVSARTTLLSNIAACSGSRTTRIANRCWSVSFCSSPITRWVSSIASVTRGP